MIFRNSINNNCIRYGFLLQSGRSATKFHSNIRCLPADNFFYSQSGVCGRWSHCRSKKFLFSHSLNFINFICNVIIHIAFVSVLFCSPVGTCKNYIENVVCPYRQFRRKIVCAGRRVITLRGEIFVRFIVLFYLILLIKFNVPHN